MQDYSNTKNIALDAISLCSVIIVCEYFRGDEAWRTTSIENELISSKFLCESEVNDNILPALHSVTAFIVTYFHNDVIGFDIAMNHSYAVNVLKTWEDLKH